jgi:hypothetical protein
MSRRKASWLNQVELWLEIIAGGEITLGSVTNPG